MINEEETYKRFGYYSTDLTYKSNKPIIVVCEYCNENIVKIKNHRTKSMENAKVKKDCCGKQTCKGAKLTETNIVDPSIGQRKAESFKQTCLDKWNVPNHQLLPEQREKQREKMAKCSPEEIARRNEMMRQTNLKKRNVEYPLADPDIKKKAEETNLKRRGSKTPFGSQEVKEKAMRNRAKKGGVASSRQQRYLHKLYGGILNPYVLNSYPDILLDDNIICEYDGRGHRLSVVLQEESAPVFDNKEIGKENKWRRNGYKIFKIISKTDKIPQDNVLMDMLRLAKEVINSGRSWITFDIDRSIVRWNENEQHYDFGFLRRIKKKDDIKN